jgi:hypothetical protein
MTATRQLTELPLRSAARDRLAPGARNPGEQSKKGSLILCGTCFFTVCLFWLCLRLRTLSTMLIHFVMS